MHRNIIRTIALAGTAVLALGAGPASAQDARPTIASIVFQGDQFMQSLQRGVRAAAQEGGAEVLEVNIDGDQARETQAIDTYISRGVDAIVIAPLSARNSAAALQRARDAGIVVVALNGGLEQDGIAQATFATENVDLGASSGEAAARFITERLGGEAEVGILAFDSLLPEQSGARVSGFREAAGEGNTLDFVSQQDAWLPERAVQVATDMLTANPDIDILYAANEGGTVGAIQAVRNSGRSGEVFVFGIDGSEQLARALLAGDDVLQATTAQSATDMGRAGAEAALELIGGEDVEAQNTVPVVLLQRGDQAGIEAFVQTLN